MKIDWGDVSPTSEMRDAVERSMEPLSELIGERLEVRRTDQGYEALLLPREGRPTALRFEGDDLLELTARAASLVRTLVRGA